MARLGIVDLGSNTARLVVFAYEPGKWFRLVDQIREPIRLGEGLGNDGRLTRAAQLRARTALELFADYASSTGLSGLEILGTSALRDAENQDEFLDLIRPLELEVSVLSGEQEARLGVLAVANGFLFEDAWVMDLGGGSAQVSLMQQREFVRGDAYPLGGVRLTERFLRSDPPKLKELKALEDEIAHCLEPVAEQFREQPLPLICMGGTIRNLARAVQKEAQYPLTDRLHGFFLSLDSLESLVEHLLTLGAKKRSRIPGIKADRADVIVAGALVFRWLLRTSRRDGVWISGHGVREGLLLRHFLPPPHLIPELRAFSVQNVLHQYAQTKQHVEQTQKLAGELFTGLRAVHGFGNRDRDLLDAGTVLQDIGLAVNYYRHDRHGAYLVASAPLNGFSHREQALMALLVRYHLRGKPRLGVYEPLCNSDDQRLLKTLAACLRVADHLERPRARRVRSVRVEITDSEIRLRLTAVGDPRIELWELDQHQSLFAEAFGRRLVVEA